MTEPTITGCKYAGRNRPRTVPGRHDGACQDDTCEGCAECPRAHCRVCGIAHTIGSCPECVASVRKDLHDIGRMCDALPEEVEYRGVHGEAMMLIGPAADPEARGHLEASVRAGRVSSDYLETADHDMHPLFVLGTHVMVWTDALEHDETSEITVATAIDYLDRQLAYMANYEHVPFEDFAHDLRDCVKHLEGVLHDQSQGDRANVACFDCGGDLERKITNEGFDDHWTCHRCRRRYTYAEYNFALRAKLEAALEESA